MSGSAPRVRAVFLAALVVAIAWAGYSFVKVRRANGEVLAYTECPFRGPALVVIRSDLAAADTLPVKVHEEVHASQCRALGPFRYRLRNLTGSGKLSLEVPAYCAAAVARLRLNGSHRAVRERMFDDLHAALHGVVDSAEITRTIARQCPQMTIRIARRGGSGSPRA